MRTNEFDCIIVGGGHAGVEAAHAAATIGAKTCLVTISKDTIAQEARHRAEQILEQARADAEATRQDADDYVIETLARIQDELERSINQVRNGIRTLEEERMRRSAPASIPTASVPEDSKSEKK